MRACLLALLLLILALLLLTLALPCLAKGTAMLAPDATVPDFALPDSAGKIVQYKSFLGKSRIVLVAVPQGASPSGGKYLENAWTEQHKFEERDTVLVMVVPAVSSLARFRSERAVIILHDKIGATMAALGATGDTPVSYLIGKDRGIKRVSAGFLPAQALFAAIDSMPMRRREMRERR